ncbi:MAG TPA: hypothetical protein VK177_16470 [Flavobacteriales bacterium]|nr:hypothetical protein [Flavobacteriales bacterium]
MKKTIYMLVGAAVLLSFGFADKTTWVLAKKDDVEEASKKVSAFYELKTNFSVNILHQTFIGHRTLTAHDQSKGYLKRKGNLFHSFMLGIHSYQDDVIRFTVDTVNRTILVADKKTGETSADLNVETLIAQKNAAAFKRSEANGNLAFRIDYKKDHPVEATELHVNNDFSIREIVIYFHNEMPVSQEENAAKAKGKAKITYSDYNMSPIFGNNEFSHKPFFTFKNTKVVKTGKYSNYTIIDNRIERKQKDDY